MPGKSDSARWNLSLVLLIGILPFFSGAAGLSHELLWTRRLIDLLGATDWVIGRVLGLFFLGLSLGGYLATLKVLRKYPAIYRLALAELLVALLALPAAFLPSWSDWIWATIGTEQLVSWQGSTIKLVLAMIVVLPPAIAMGLTLPFFVEATFALRRKAGSTGVWIYSINTVGGVFGLWFTSTHLIQWMGALSSMLFLASVNAAVSVFVIAIAILSRKTGGETSKSQQASKSTTSDVDSDDLSTQDVAHTPGWELYALSFISGFIVLSLEILLLRIISLVVPSSYHTTSALLANVILILAISSGAVSLFYSFKPLKSKVTGKWLLAIGVSGAAVFICLCPRFLFAETNQLISIRYLQSLDGNVISSINHYWQLVFWLVASIGGLALLFAGLVFPSLIALSSQKDTTGQRIGLLLAANGVGGLLGSEITNTLVVGSIGFYHGFTLLALFAMVVAIFLWLRLNWYVAIPVTLAMTFGILSGHNNNCTQPYVSPRASKRFVVKQTRFGRDGVLSVVADRKGARSILMNNQYILGSTNAALDERRQLIIPWLLSNDAKTVCCLGLATGISAGGLEKLADPPAITSVELSLNVEKVARENFGAAAQDFFERDNNQVVIEDARTFIAASESQFDLIVADLFRPHGAGEGRLFSLEHFENIRRALNDEGMVCQWLPLHQLNQENFEIIAATFQEVFPRTLVVYGSLSTSTPVIGLVARKNDQAWTREFIESCFVQEKLARFRDRVLAHSKSLVVGELKPAGRDTPINTLDNLLIEINASRSWILADLRKSQAGDISGNEFISGPNLIPFNQYLEKSTTPIFPRAIFQQLQQRIKRKFE